MSLRPYQCPYPACEWFGEPVRGRERTRAKSLWLCEVCKGRLPLSTPRRQRPRARRPQEW